MEHYQRDPENVLDPFFYDLLKQQNLLGFQSLKKQSF